MKNSNGYNSYFEIVYEIPQVSILSPVLCYNYIRDVFFDNRVSCLKLFRYSEDNTQYARFLLNKKPRK